jgi:hypothetical protein
VAFRCAIAGRLIHAFERTERGRPVAVTRAVRGRRPRGASGGTASSECDLGRRGVSPGVQFSRLRGPLFGPGGVFVSGANEVLENRRFSGCGESAIRNSSEVLALPVLRASNIRQSRSKERSAFVSKREQRSRCPRGTSSRSVTKIFDFRTTTATGRWLSKSNTPRLRLALSWLRCRPLRSSSLENIVADRGRIADDLPARTAACRHSFIRSVPMPMQ